MKHFSLIVIAISLFSTLSSGQTLKGRITDQRGQPVQYSTIYIKELRQGTTSNTVGDYNINLPEGKYTIIYQSLGYQPVLLDITISGITVKDIVLPTQLYEIPEVRIMATGEDPAYAIMRKAIGLAPYYLNNVSRYKADVYLKGNLVINKIPKLLQKSMKMNENSVSVGTRTKTEDNLLKAGDSFLMESMNEIEFTTPDKYVQKVISYNSTFPAQGNEISPMSFIQASFYQPVLADMAISPLAPNAFIHYRFKYLGATRQGNFTINKIEVIPKHKSQQLFEGFIYIIDDLWCIESLDLTNDNFFGTIKIQQLYIPVEDGIWMPVSHKFEINIGIIGFKADVGYGSSVKYIEVKPNVSLQKPASLLTDHSAIDHKIAPDTIISKQKKQINKILEKNKLSNRDMAKLVKLMQKESDSSVDSGKKRLEIKENPPPTIEKDANKKDSAYWANVRPIPLSDIELRTLIKSDSIKLAKKQTESNNDSVSVKNKSKINTKKPLHNILFGHTWSDTTGFVVTTNGIIDPKKFSFNTVDGFCVGMNLSISKTWKNQSSISFVPEVQWAFSRKELMWDFSSNYWFNKMKHSQVFIRAGDLSKDINSGGGINLLINTIYSLLFRKNYLKLYESQYLTLGYSSDLANGLNLSLSGNYEYRKTLQNSTKFSVFNTSKDYSDNTPINPYLLPGSNEINELRNQEHLDLTTQLTFTPMLRYRIIKGAKIPEGSDWPTFNLTWVHGINDFSEIQQGLRRTDMLRFEVSRGSDIGAFSYFRWRLRTAGYLDNRNLTFYDFFHINTQPLPILLNNFEDAFMIPSFYSLSTPEFYVEAHLKYTSPYILLKLLPGLSNTLMRENICFSYLGSRFRKSYSEVGYSISEILFVGELGVYAGFDNLTYRSIGLKATFKFN